MDDILNCQRSPLIKTSFGYVGESSCRKDEDVKKEEMSHDEDGEKLHAKNDEKPHVKEEKKPHAKNEEKPQG